LYLDRRYILDGPFDVAGPKELYEREKVTIRLVAPAKLEHLVSFVGHYSISPAVDRILVLWHGPAEIPKDDIFRYTTTHSKVVFEKIESASFWESYLRTDNINTPGLFIVDGSTMISCEQLLFGNNVWRSSFDAIVGITPNLIESDPLKNHQLVIKPAKSVAWSNSYNLLSWDGIFVNKLILEKLLNSKDVLDKLKSGQLCIDYIVPLFALKDSGSPPIWVDVEKETLTRAETLPISKLFTDQFGTPLKISDDCLIKTMEVLKTTELLPSYGKSSMAKDFIFW